MQQETGTGDTVPLPDLRLENAALIPPLVLMPDGPHSDTPCSKNLWEHLL